MKDEQRLALKELKLVLSRQLQDNLKEVVLFGSQLSTGTNKDDADFDILIILKKTADWEMQRTISDLCYEVELRHDIIIDSHILSEEEFNTPRGKQPIFINAIEKGLYI